MIGEFKILKKSVSLWCLAVLSNAYLLARLSKLIWLQESCTSERLLRNWVQCNLSNTTESNTWHSLNCLFISLQYLHQGSFIVYHLFSSFQLGPYNSRTRARNPKSVKTLYDKVCCNQCFRTEHILKIPYVLAMTSCQLWSKTFEFVWVKPAFERL